ncbi:hypothetical protein KO516_06650 [Citreicella sp. C3M06]|uniref:alpha/beta hydrolase n=1 Tax=Citreicella sp. C3M06 TaxID=2841564 RepID=UPI001C094812|nr:alpha/beta hydrolase [Citreicella sp. C3M06]MBU2960497.1 hypothetical protein [Citreicella sp. C3M06]
MSILVLVWGAGLLESFSSISAYLKSYLRDEPQSGQPAGIRAMTRRRVLDLLDQLETNPTVHYDEIYVVGHSLGGVIAVDALAEFGDRNDGVVLFTWGSMLGLVTQQEPLIEAEIAKCYEAPTRLKGWIDIVFAKDMLSSRVPVPRRRTEGGGFGETHARVFAASRSPRLPRGLSIFELASVHDAYFRCEDAMLMLVGPASALPAPDLGTPEAAQTSAAISR